MKTIVDYLHHWAARQPAARLFTFLDVDGAERETLTWAEFHDRTALLAAVLVAQKGMRPGERALLVYPPGLELIAAFIACARTGVIPVPAYPPAAADLAEGLARLARIAADCDARAALTVGAFRDLAGELRHPPYRDDFPALARLDWIATDDFTDPAPAQHHDRPGPVLFLQYTSGATSEPKGVVVGHDNLLHNALNALDHRPVEVSWLPQYHDMGLIGAYLYPLIRGGSAFGFAPADFLARPLLWLETIGRVHATGSGAPNFGFEYCLREDKVPTAALDQLDLSSLRILANAAEPVRAETCERFLARFARCGLRPAALVAAYGLAENTLAVTSRGRRIAIVDKELLQQGRARDPGARTPEHNRLRLVSCGSALAGIDVRIVDPESCRALSDRQVGEIWVAGDSTCAGYWNQPGRTAATFRQAIANDPAADPRYLRTGDLGFLQDDELFVCGRRKDMIIVRGVNHYPQDIEAAVQSSSPKIRSGGVAAFAVREHEGDDELALLIELRKADDRPDPATIARTVRNRCRIEPRVVAFVAANAIAKTTSGKIARGETRRRWQDGALVALATHRFAVPPGPAAGAAGLPERFTALLAAYGLTGQEEITLADVGLDSVVLVSLLDDVRDVLAAQGLADLGARVDLPLLQRVSVAEFSAMLASSAQPGRLAAPALSAWLDRAAAGRAAHEAARMRADAVLDVQEFQPPASRSGPPTDILVTGATGFFGAFCLASLLRTTTMTCHVLVRAGDAAHGLNRIRAALRRAGVAAAVLDEALPRRVRVVCGDLAAPRLGLDPDAWDALAGATQAVFHCAALVNYNLTYDALRAANVEATRELLRLAVARTRKTFHFVSTTFIFGWTTLPLLLEHDDNAAMADLDLGYAQSKWVAEQLVFAAAGQGLPARVYRASTISASTTGSGNRDDVVVRLLAFMINHGLSVEATIQVSLVPADIAADNIAAIVAQQPAAARTLHVTADRYCNIADITRLITRDHGYPFAYHDIPGFVAELNRRCLPDDPLHPLLDFINRAQPRVQRMQAKRYDNAAYRAARDACFGSRADPTLSDCIGYVLAYLRRERLIGAAPGRDAAGTGTAV